MHPIRMEILPLDSIRIDPKHPRQPGELFDESNRLLRSMREFGILTEMAVCERGGGTYLIIDGNRRYYCARKLAMDVVPCRVYPPLSQAEIQTKRYIRH